jgi:hypothetical protein
MDKHDRLLGTFRPDIDHAQRHIRQTAYRDINPVKVKIQLDVPLFESTQFSLHLYLQPGRGDLRFLSPSLT